MIYRNFLRTIPHENILKLTVSIENEFTIFSSEKFNKRKVSKEVFKIDFTFEAPETFLSYEVRMTKKHHRLDTPFEKTSKRLVTSPKG